jgi:glycosyltransferase involved in cell wall biosynthesis
MTRVAFLYLGRRGAGAMLSLETARALCAKSDLLVLVSAQIENRAGWEELPCETVFVDTFRSPLDFVLRSVNPLTYRRIARAIRQFRADVVYTPMLHHWNAPLGPFLGRTPTVPTIHDPVQHSGERRRVVDWLQRAVVRRASRVICLSRALVGDVVALGIDAERVDVVQLGQFGSYPRPEGAEARPPVDPAVRARTALFFGRIVAYKGVGVLLDAFRTVLRTVPDARLLLVGSGDISPYADALNELDNVDLVNRWIADDEVTGYVDQAAFCVVPYIDATQSALIPLAYAEGLPVVASRTGGLSEQVWDGETGFLVPPSDSAALADVWVRMLGDPVATAAMGEKARETARTVWNWDRIGDEILEALGRATGRP